MTHKTQTLNILIFSPHSLLPYCKIAVKCTDTENVQMNTCDVMCRNKSLFRAYLLFFLKNYVSAHIRDMLTLAAPTLLFLTCSDDMDNN